ncbi:ATP-dependent DNA ligase, partial [Bacillus pumilus]|uniref:ATP-dependent DNA ligase n=1 Tax=Bacillus pumilus TaxID=1408 RepID=UPI0028CB9A68
VYLNYERYEGKEVIVTKKLDGNRYAIFVRDDGSVKLYSREGHILDGCEEIEEAMSDFPRGYVYDGEILATNEEGLSSQELYTKTSKILRKKGVKKGVEFHAFDIIPIPEFEKGYWGVCCKQRKSGLKKLIEKMDKHLIKNVDTIYVGEYDFDEIERLSELAKENKEEGIMVQLADASYQCKRTFDILKVKSFESADIRCLDVYEGKKESTKGKLGGVVLDFKGYRVNVGIGFSEQERIDLWKNPDQIIGKIVEIKYFEQFLQDDGTIDLRFASFKTIRTDKTEPSYH